MSKEMNDRIKLIVCDVVEIEPSELTDDTPFADVGVDSMTAIEILAALEVQLGVTIDQDDLPNMASLSGIYKVVAGYLDGR